MLALSTDSPKPSARLLVVNQQRAHHLWEQLQPFPDTLRLLRVDDEASWLARLSDPGCLFYTVDQGLALLAALDIEPGHGATVVVVGFDHQLQPHAAGFAEALRHMVGLCQLRRLTTYVPASVPVLAKLVTKHLGFAWEGVLREGWGPGEDLHVNGWVTPG